MNPMIEMAIYLAVFLGFNAPLLLLRSRAIDEVNQCTDDKFSLFMWNWQAGRLWRVHKLHFPNSRLRLWNWCVTAIAVVWMFFGLKLIQILHGGLSYLLGRISLR